MCVHPGKQWRMDGITDISYEEVEAKISFKTDSFQAFVLMQETYANLPLQSWELRPLGQDSALFTVNGALISLSVTIQVRDWRALYMHNRRINQMYPVIICVCAYVTNRVISVCCSQSKREVSHT